jgi:hypothetical protein
MLEKYDILMSKLDGFAVYSFNIDVIISIFKQPRSDCVACQMPSTSRSTAPIGVWIHNNVGSALLKTEPPRSVVAQAWGLP